LHPGPDSGLAGIIRAGLEDEFTKYARPEGDEKRILDKDGFVYLNLKGKSERPEIDRRQFLPSYLSISLELLMIQVNFAKSCSTL
jgi:hypothetical protein